MSLHNGVDYVAVVAGGIYTETYGSTAQANINNLAASRGLLEDAPNIIVSIINIVMSYFRRRYA